MMKAECSGSRRGAQAGRTYHMLEGLQDERGAHGHTACCQQACAGWTGFEGDFTVLPWLALVVKLGVCCGAVSRGWGGWGW